MIDFLRLMSIFGGLGSGGGGGGGYNTPPINSGPSGYMPNMSGSYQNFQDPNPYEQPQPYQPTRTMQDRFMELMQSFPERENPSGWRKVGAFLTGLGGENASEAFQLSHQVANMPHMMKMQDWGAQVKPVMEAAENERLYNQYEQTRLLNERKQEEAERYNRDRIRISDERLDEQNRAALSREDTARRNVAVREAYQQMRALRDKNSHTFKTREDGVIVAINNMDPTQVISTGVKSNELSDLDKINLNLDADIKLAGVRHGNTEAEIEQRGEEARRTAAERERLLQTRPPTTRPGGSGNLEETRRVTNKLQQMGIERPDLFRHIQNGTIKPGTPDNIRAEINQYVYGETRMPAASGVQFNTQRYDSKVEAVIADAVKAGMKREDVIAQLKQRGIIR